MVGTFSLRTLAKILSLGEDLNLTRKLKIFDSNQYCLQLKGGSVPCG